jgi:hypothetical protein
MEPERYDVWSAIHVRRSAREWDAGHITKPPRRSASAPFAAGQDAARFVLQVSSKFPSKVAKLIVVSASSSASCYLARQSVRATPSVAAIMPRQKPGSAALFKQGAGARAHGCYR